VFHLDDVVREVIELMAAEVRDRRLSVLIKGEGHELWADRRRLFRVMVNLLDNAVKNSPAGGRVTVVLTGEDGRLSVAVEDEGRGFEACTLDKLFEPSRLSSTPTRGGTGLGLYLCRLVIGAHKGAIIAENRREGGARFTFSIPNDRRKSSDGYLHSDRRRPASVQAQPEDGA
jgi:two-component system sensor histidine kinase KdpD